MNLHLLFSSYEAENGVLMALRDPRARSQQHGQPRNPDPTNSRSWGDATDIMGDVPHQFAKEALIPAIANRTRNAVNVDRREVFYYQRLRSGRRCSCWSSPVETSPQANCPICFSTGWAGGFLKWGTSLNLFDPSRQWLGVNVRLTSEFGAPLWWTLVDEAKAGYVEWTEQLENLRPEGLDAYGLNFRRGRGATSFGLRLEGVDPTFVPFTEEALKQRVLQIGTSPSGQISFRFRMSRPAPEAESPILQYFWFRSLLVPGPPVLFVDIPRRVESNMLAEYGALETFQPIQMAFPDTLQRVNLEDLVVRLYDMTRWKVIESNPNDPLNLLTSHDVQVRKVFQHEALWTVPL